MSPQNASGNGNGNGNPSEPAPSASGAPPAPRRVWIGLAVLGAALAVILLVALAWRSGEGTPGAGEANATPTATPTASPSPTAAPEASAPPATDRPTATPAPTPSATAAPGQTAAPGVPRPTLCTQLYSPAMVQALRDLALNPDWSQDPDSSVSHGTDDDELRTLIDTLDHLTCVWASPYGGSETGIITNVVWVNPEQSAAVEARLVADGLECFDQSEGRRCVIQTNTVDGAYGESHFLRNGLWIATRYTNAGPLGYTQDIINNLWVGV